MTKYSVLLQHPDDFGATPADRTFYAWVEAYSPSHAIRKAQIDAFIGDCFYDSTVCETDYIYWGNDRDELRAYAPLLVIKGYHNAY